MITAFQDNLLSMGKGKVSLNSTERDRKYSNKQSVVKFSSHCIPEAGCLHQSCMTTCSAGQCMELGPTVIPEVRMCSLSAAGYEGLK